jgi:diphosphate-dependent phosphofructokinase
MKEGRGVEAILTRLGVRPAKAFLQRGKLTALGFSSAGKTAVLDAVKVNLPHVSTQPTLVAKKHMSAKPKRVAVLFSGGPAAGGHNVLVGLQQILGKSTLLGVRGGPKGLLAGELFEIHDTKHLLNTGGFDFLGTDRTKIRTQEQLQQVKEVCVRHKIDALVIIGGDDSATNAAFLSEYLYGLTQVISVPKTMDGDLQARQLPISFGFDTATRTYAELVGNICRDTRSSQKYWHFVKLMGRTASHVTLEVALLTQPTIALISEEIAHQQLSLSDIVNRVAHIVVERSHHGKDYGVVVVPEGLLEFIPEINSMIDELNRILHPGEMRHITKQQRIALVHKRLSHHNSMLFARLPLYIQEMLVADRDAHSNLQVSQIETERLLADMVASRVREMSPKTRLLVNKHFYGYEGRCAPPTLFDSWLSYNLGLTAGSLVLDNRTGYLACFTDFDKGGRPVGIPLASMMAEDKHKHILVVEKTLVDLHSAAFKMFAKHRDAWAKEDHFIMPGPIQYFGPTAVQMPLLVSLNRGWKKGKF